MKKRITVGLLVLIVLLGAWVVRLYWLAGEFKKIEPHFAGTCRAVGGVTGPEDITIHPRTGVAYVSAFDRRAVMAGRPGRGAIFAYDLKQGAPEPVNLTPGADPDFRPHGVSLFAGEDGGAGALFVINHQGGDSRIEVFDLREGALIHRKAIPSPALVSPNDLVAVGPESFYVTNDHRYARGWMRTVEDYLRLRLSNVVFYDGKEFVEAASGIGYANGINVSPDGRLLYVSAVTEGSVHVYDRDTASGRLSHRDVIRLRTGVDNIEVDAEGDLWIGAHPKLLTYVKHAKDPRKVSPSQVLRISPRPGGGGYAVEEVYLDTGHPLSGSSVAAVWGRHMLIGAIFESKFLDCTR